MNGNRVRDEVAEKLERARLYRRAANRWMTVFDLCADDDDREWVARHRERCLERAGTAGWYD